MPDIFCLFEKAKESELDLWMARIPVLLIWIWSKGFAQQVDIFDDWF